jgi:hypothetical protein
VLIYPPLHCVALLWRRPIVMITNTHFSASCKRGQQHRSCSSSSVAGQGESHHGPQLRRGRAVNDALRTPDKRDRVAQKFGRSRNQERATKEVERTQEADAREEGGRWYLWPWRKQRGSYVYDLYQDSRSGKRATNGVNRLDWECCLILCL